jgi:hypothetical protein
MGQEKRKVPTCTAACVEKAHGRKPKALQEGIEGINIDIAELFAQIGLNGRGIKSHNRRLTTQAIKKRLHIETRQGFRPKLRLYYFHMKTPLHRNSLIQWVGWVAGIACISPLPITAVTFDCPPLAINSLFPSDNPWHYDISHFPIHPNSDKLVASVGLTTSLHPDFGTEYDGQPMGIPYTVVGAGQALSPITYTDYGDESDPGPFPIPLTAPIEGGAASDGDRHVLVVDTAGHMLYELFGASVVNQSWSAASGAKYDLTRNTLRTEGWTSADAAGLPILPGLVRYDEVQRGLIDHAIRLTVKTSRQSYLYPARHQAGSTTSTDVPAMGERYRLKANFDITSYPPSMQVILHALKTYGFIVADNGGNWFFSGSPHSQWKDDEINTLKRLKGSDFEAVLTVDNQGQPLKPAPIHWFRQATARHSSYRGHIRMPTWVWDANALHVYNGLGHRTVTPRHPILVETELRKFP